MRAPRRGERPQAYLSLVVAEAIRLLWQATHNLAEGAGAIAMGALMQEREAMRGKKVAVILSGGNLDMKQAAEVLGGRTPAVAAWQIVHGWDI